MKIASLKIFENHFSPESLKGLIDTHLKPSSARGVDGINYEGFLEKIDGEVQLISSRALCGKYRFTPFRQKLIIKDAKSPPRQVSIPTIRDKVALRALNNFLSDCFPDARPQHSHPIISSAITSAKNALPTDNFIKLDIRSFYDGIDHKVLMKNLRAKIRSSQPLSMIEAAIRTPTGARASDPKINPLGVPQGLSISNILASIYLESIDDKYAASLGLSYHRYVDDILCITSSVEAAAYAAAISGDLKRKKS